MKINSPALVVGLTVTVYWARVLRMTFKAKRHTGSAAGLVPRERLGRAIRLIWFPVVGAWIAIPWLVAFGHRLPSGLTPLYTNHWLQWTCAVVGVGALAATMACWKRMGHSWRMGINPGEKTALVVDGAFAYVRHPIYALSSLLMWVTMGIVPAPWMIGVGVMHLTLLQWESRREERHLTAIHGDEYTAYRARVGRFIPRLTLRPDGGKKTACGSQARG